MCTRMIIDIKMIPVLMLAGVVGLILICGGSVITFTCLFCWRGLMTLEMKSIVKKTCTFMTRVTLIVFTVLSLVYWHSLLYPVEIRK